MAYYPNPTTTPAKQRSILVPALVMLVGPIVFFFLPGIASFVFGIIGGKMAGSVGRAVTAALLPAIVAGAIVLLFSIIGGPLGLLAGLFSGAALIFVAIVHGLALLIGAIIGGLL